METIHMILGAIVAAVLVTSVYNHVTNGKNSVIEGLESGSNGTISDQLKAATKALDGGTELMSEVADLSKNKTEVTELIAAYKSYLKHSIAAGVILNATSVSKDLGALTDGSTEAKQRENDLRVYKTQLDYVATAEEIVNGSPPVISGKKAGGWLN